MLIYLGLIVSVCGGFLAWTLLAAESPFVPAGGRRRHTCAGNADPEGARAPKVEAACQFVQASGRLVAIGSLADIDPLLAGVRGTQISQKGA